jgi:hypothetical protein
MNITTKITTATVLALITPSLVAATVPTSEITGNLTQNQWSFALSFNVEFDSPVDFITVYADGHPGWYSNIVPTSSLSGALSGFLPPDFDPDWLYGPGVNHALSYNFVFEGQTYEGENTFAYYIQPPTDVRPPEADPGTGNGGTSGGGGGNAVPDSGSTIPLLGLALGSLVVAAKRK